MRASGNHRVATIVAFAVVVVLVLSMLSAVTQASRLGTSGGSSSSSPTSHTVATPVAKTQATTKVKPSGATGPHPGTLDIYESAGAGTTVDPSAAYYTVNAEPIDNVYETLIAFNGTQNGPAASNYVPQGATCVPGSSLCLAQFANSLVYNNQTTGAPEYYTFEIDGNAQFYDPATGNHWGVYPSDVLFSMARTLGFSEYPGFGYYNGWINAQAVLPPGNSSWDGGLHGIYNNTPSHVLGAFLVNNSTYCPSPVAGSGLVTHGCITWDVGASGAAWPYVLELISDPLGGSIQSCGAFTYLGGGVPDFAGSSASHGDGPCTLPGGYTTTDSSQVIGGMTWSQYINSLSPTSWDAFQQLGINYPSPQSGVQWNMIGSGPYYNINPVNPGEGYFLRANPDYSAPQGCAGQAGCFPVAGKYIPNVNVYWGAGDTVALQQMAAGYADSGAYATTDTAQVLNIVAQGDYALDTGIPTISIYFDPFELNFSLANLAKQDPINTINVPGDFLSNIGLREFLVNAFPYQTDEQTLQTIDGIQYGIHYGGMIPQFMGTYYPTNISWPGGNPSTGPNSTTGSAQWWWSQVISPSSPFYDPTFAACTSSSPCKFPFVGVIEGPSVGLSMKNWLASIESLTGNAVQPYEYDIHQSVLATNVGLPPGQGDMTIYSYGWAPDYPDPTDYVAPMYFPDATYTYPDAVGEQLGLAQYNNDTACGHYGVDPNNVSVGYVGAWTNLSYWASGAGGADGVGIALACQGIAYSAMIDWMTEASHLSNLPQRQLDYNVAEHIANYLALYLYWNQGVGAIDYGVWINPSGINYNIMYGGGGDQLWMFWGYASNAFTATFSESGLPTGTTWSVNMLGVGTANSTGTTIVFNNVPNGTYPYTVNFVSGYAVSPASGSMKVSGGPGVATVVFTALTGTAVPVQFIEQGLVAGTNWTVSLTNVGSFSGNATIVNLALPAGSYPYTTSAVPGYTAPAAGTLTVSTSAVVQTLTYSGIVFTTFPVNFVATGLPTGQTWTMSIAGYVDPTSALTQTFWEKNGTYPWVYIPIPGLAASPDNGTFTVNGNVTNIPITFSIVGVHYELTFTEGGLPAGTEWTINVNSRAVPTTQAYLQVLVVNGSFPWTVTPVSGFDATPNAGTVTVAGGSPAAIAIQFAAPTPTYTVSFSQLGSTISAWTLYIGNNSYPATTNKLSISLPAGTYAWGVTLPSGYVASPASGTLVVTATGANSQSFTVSATSTSTGGGINATTGLSTLAYALIGIFVLLTVVFLVTTLMARRRPPSQPPQSWSPGNEPKGGDANAPPPPSS